MWNKSLKLAMTAIAATSLWSAALTSSASASSLFFFKGNTRAPNERICLSFARSTARVDLDACTGLGVRLHGPVRAVVPAAASRRSRTAGRLRRVRCTADARPVHRLQRLCSDPVGARRDGDRLQHPGPRGAQEHEPVAHGDVIAKIYMGQITNWNDPAIKALNPKATLPDQKITPVYRTGNSGTTYNFTDYLSSVSATWKSPLGTGQSVNWPTGIGANGIAGVAGTVSQTPGTIGYTDTAFAIANHLRFASIKNAAGNFINPSIRNVAAAGGAVTKVPANNELHIVNPPKSLADRVPDRDLHLHHPSDQVDERDRAPEDGLLGTDPGQSGEVHGQALVRADPEGRARRVGEDAEPGQAGDVSATRSLPVRG